MNLREIAGNNSIILVVLKNLAFMFVSKSKLIRSTPTLFWAAENLTRSRGLNPWTGLENELS